MKKKLMILILVVAVVLFVGYTTIRSDKTTKAITKEWSFSADVIDSLSLLGAEQDVKTTIIETEKEETVVKLAGKVSDKTDKELDKVKTKAKSLEITLSDTDGFKLMPSSDGKSELEMQVFLDKNASIKNLKIESIVGNVDVMVPQDFQGKYVTSAKNGGEVLAVPDTSKDQDEVIEISTIGDIRIKK
ncbi:hypothetical protein [Enterococcus rotai]|uniref:hypothetical protein n=1 Tax=Enterococcus rotai TaxID=118060 RepID=UPI0035C6BB7B